MTMFEQALRNCVGKTVKEVKVLGDDDSEDVGYQEQFILRFTDNTYLQVDMDYDDTGVIIPPHSLASLDVECPEEDE